MKTGVTIVIPTRNEADNIDYLLQRLLAVELPEGVEREVIFVDDSSTDATREKVRAWTGEHPVTLICRDCDKGLAGAVIAGAHKARYDIVLVMDADLSHPPERIPDIIKPLLAETSDMVIGSRYTEGGATPEWPLSRRIASKLATMPARLFTDADDPLAGFFAVKKERLTALRPDVPGFKIGLEVLAVGGDDLRLSEVPIIFNDRFEGFSKMNKRVIFEYLQQVVQLARFDSKTFSPGRLLAFGGLGVVLNVLFFAVLRGSGVSMLSAPLVAQLGGGAMLCCLIAGLWRKADPANTLSGYQWSGGFGALVLALIVQGGVFRTIHEGLVGNEAGAFFGATVFGTFFFLGIVSVFFFSGFISLPQRAKTRFAVFALIFVALVIRLCYLGLPELMEQEAYYWNYSRHPDLSYLDHPPLVAMLIWFGTLVFGTNEFGVRIGALICWFFTAFFSYRLSSRIFGRTAGLGAILLIAVLPLYFGTGLIITPDSSLHAAWAAVLYYLYRALVEEKSEAWLGVGISFGLGLISKYTIVLLGPALLCFMLVDRRARTWFFRSEPIGALLLAVLFLTPVLIWNIQHDWASFLFQGERRISGQLFFTTHRLAGYLCLILTPAGILAALHFFFRGNRFFTQVGLISQPDDGRRYNPSYLFLLLHVLSPLLVFFVFSLTKEVKLNWASPLWLAAIPLMACTVTAVCGEYRSTFLGVVHGLWKVTVIVLLFTYGGALYYVTLGLPGIAPPPGPFLIGWDGFAEKIETVVDEVAQQTGKRPLVVGMDPYQISSGLAFYRTKNLSDQPPEVRRRGIEETVGWHLFGWNSLMYRYWSDPAKFQGRDILVVASSKIRVEYPYFQHLISGMDNIQAFDTLKQGKPARRFYIRLVHGYRPPQR